MRSILSRLLATLALAVALVAPAAAQDYDYYLVKAGDTLESIGAAHGMSGEGVLYSNRQVLGEEGRLEPGMVLAIPRVRQEKEEPRRSPSSRKKPTATRHPSSGWGHVSRSGGTVVVQGSPTPSNTYVGSDGRVVRVPTYVPPVDPEEERRSLSSRSGRNLRGVLLTARRFLGVPYVWGGETSSGFDCSGFVMYVFAMHGVVLPRTADVQFNAGRAVPRGQEQPGDLVFFETYAPGASHVGIYLGGGQFIHASSVGFVRISSLQEEFFMERYLGARRVL